MTRYLAPLAALLIGAPSLAAQAVPPADTLTAAATTDTIFVRAQRMAAEGQGDAARALVQHEIDIAAAGSPRYVDALYWRAVVAATAADAERDLRRIIIEFPLSQRNEDALLRLAQLEMTRGDNDQALTHLQRLVIDHPASPSRARASFWMARVYFDKNQTPAACRSLADASHNTSPGQVEQRNQIDFWMQRCHGMDTAAVASASPDSAPRASAQTTTASAPQAPPPPPPAISSPPPASAAPTPSSTTTAKKTTTTVTTTTVTRAPASGGKYTVQVGAYPTRSAAESLQKSLVARGYGARIYGTAKPFRVRVGYYDTRAQADAAAQQMKAKQIAVYVTEAEPR
ncbi:MAG: SPOR domain-containing protein [Gemmatimonadota bacterium]|nr:SPOR domain-containing protein [Gemmatimonadota bacterium]